MVIQEIFHPYFREKNWHREFNLYSKRIDIVIFKILEEEKKINQNSTKYIFVYIF